MAGLATLGSQLSLGGEAFSKSESAPNLAYLGAGAGDKTLAKTASADSFFADEDEKGESDARIKKIFFDKNKADGDSIYRFRKVKGAQAVGNIAEMANGLKKDDRHCDVVVVSGHGAPSHQGLGSSTNGEYSKGQDFCYDELGDIEEELSVIQEYIAPQKGRPTPVLFLSGCDVGMGIPVETATGKKKKAPVLLQQLSCAFEGVAVVAATCRMSVEAVRKKKGQVVFQKVQAEKLSRDPVTFACALNGKVVTLDPLDSRKDQFASVTGHETLELVADLLLHGDD